MSKNAPKFPKMSNYETYVTYEWPLRHSAFLQQSANRLDNVANNRNGTPNDSR